MANQVVIKGTPVKYEYVGSGAITPGHLLYLTNTGVVAVHAAAGQNCEPFFALEDELQNKDLTDAYTTATQVQTGIFRPGDVVNALIADGETITDGMYLESNGNGELKEHGADSAGIVEYPNAIVGLSLDDVDMSDSSGADPDGRCRVRIT